MSKKSLRLGKGRPGKEGGKVHKARVARRRDRINIGRGGIDTASVPQHKGW